jgi:radical SAM superfamily enzyme YgiQ (UPF0313 family)
VSFPVVKRIMPKLPPPVTQFIVPNVQTVHDRLSVEIMRGCTRGAAFATAGWLTAVRERSVEDHSAIVMLGGNGVRRGWLSFRFLI